MATIEERAKAYADSQVNIETQDLCRMEGYLVGATEQKKIDIDRACEWLARTFISLCVFDDSTDSFICRFRKEMTDYDK